MRWNPMRALARALGRRAEGERDDVVGIDGDDPCHDEHDDRETSDGMSDRYPWELLVRYGAGRVTPGEAERVEAWSAEDPEHARLARRITRLVSVSRAADDARTTDRAWGRLQHRIEEADLAAERPRVLHVRRRFQATFPASEASGWWTRVAAGAIAAAAVVAVGVWGWRAAQPPVMREVATRPGERLEIGLPDGSRVVLGAASRIRFTSGRFAHARTIDLDGEAYFTVAHDTKHPFVVRTHGAAVQAVGTAFDVRSYAEDSVVNVAVSEGRVVLRPQSGAIGTGTLLGRGDLGQMDADGRASVQHDANIDRYLAWVRGRLVYDMAPVTMIVHDLERWYDLAITIDDHTRSTLGVTMTIDPTQPAPRALQRLAEVLNLHVVQQGRHVELTAGAATAP